jgi:hypothetical protein
MPLVPDVVRERLFSGQRGCDCHGRVSKGVKAERTQPMPLISTNPPNL